MMQKWSKETAPNKKSNYTHVKIDTPIGESYIEWKSWKNNPSYDVTLGDKWIGYENSLDSAKDLLEKHLLDVTNELQKFCSPSS